MAPSLRTFFAAGAAAQQITVASASAASSGELFFAASAGCDAEDPTPCPGSPDKKLWSYTLAKNGEMLLNEKIDINSTAPVWLTTQAAADGAPQCLFVSLADSSKMLAYKVDGSKLVAVDAGVDARGINPVHASISSDGRALVVANYHGPDDVCDSTGSSVASFRIGDDCSLSFADNKPHSGSSKIKSRQCASHIHSVTAGRNMLAFACDLGSDIIFSYKIGQDGTLTEVAKIATEPGTGPRHAVLHPTKDILYVVSEMSSQVLTYSIADSGALQLLNSQSTQPQEQLTMGYGSKAAEILLAADGKTLYASNRAFDPKFRSTVAVFSVNEDGTLTAKQQVDGPNYPRGMVLSQDDSYMVVASQHTGILESFKVLSDGSLRTSGFSVQGPPTCAALSTPLKPSTSATSVLV